MNRKITKYEQFLCLQMFETLYLTETSGTQIVIQRVPGGYMWRDWSREQGTTDGFNAVFVKWDGFFIGIDDQQWTIPACYLIGNKNVLHKKYFTRRDEQNRNLLEIYDIMGKKRSGKVSTYLLDSPGSEYFTIATYEDGVLDFKGELE